MIKTSLFLLLSTVLVSSRSKACDCLAYPPFCETIALLNKHRYQVEHVKIIGKDAYGFAALVLHNYFGDSLAGSKENYYDGSGSCFMSLYDFKVGEEYIFIGMPYFDGFGLWSCGTSFLKVENGLVKGKIAPGISAIPLHDFTSLANCGKLKTSATTEAPDFDITVNPTLIDDHALVQTTFTADQNIELTIFDALGRSVYETQSVDFNDTRPLSVDFEGYYPGLYFIRICADGRQKTVKVLKH
jgi:hypothetical protein